MSPTVFSKTSATPLSAGVDVDFDSVVGGHDVPVARTLCGVMKV